MKIHNVTPYISQNLNKNNQSNKNVSFSGNPPNKLVSLSERFFNLKRVGTMNMELFVANAFVFLLGGRLISSRDKNERRETLTRDIPTIITAVYGVPFVESFAARLIHDKKGFAIGDKKGKYQLDVANFSKLDDWYRYDSKLEGGKGFDGFLERLESKGGDLNKICSSFGDKIKDKLKDLKNNTEFKDKLFNDKELKNDLITEFSKQEGNKALKLARRFKTIPKIIGFVITLSTIGIFIPKLNIHITEKVNKNAKRREALIKKEKEDNEIKKS